MHKDIPFDTAHKMIVIPISEVRIRAEEAATSAVGLMAATNASVRPKEGVASQRRRADLQDIVRTIRTRGASLRAGPA
jgi:hypothetical protein